MKITLKKLNQRGMFHVTILLPILVVAAIAAVGLRIMLINHAATCVGAVSFAEPSPNPGTLTYGPGKFCIQNGNYQATFGLNGNFALTSSTTTLWSSKTANKGATSLSLMSNGAMTIYKGTTVLWTSNKFNYYGYGAGGEYLSLTSEGSLYEGNQPNWNEGGGTGYIIWQVGTYLQPILPIPDTLSTNCVIASTFFHQPANFNYVNGTFCLQNGNYKVLYGVDGNLVIYNGTTPVWASNTANKGANRLCLQGDGNIVIYDVNKAIWASNKFNVYSGGNEDIALNGDQLREADYPNALKGGGAGATVWEVN